MKYQILKSGYCSELEKDVNKLITKGTPKEIHLAVVIAAPEGIKYLESQLPHNCHLWIASIDEKLNEKNYIIPGLGDAGDLAFGTKL
jgi:uracil phosphoribosyltransferase